MPLRVLHLNTYEHGGAARAARALHEALLQAGVESTFRTAQGPRFRAARAADRALLKLQRSPRHPWRDTARFSSITAKEINAFPADVVNLHWVADGFLSIEEIGRIEKPIVWSMYDIWPFAGTEHYEAAPAEDRPKNGYLTTNRPPDESGLDIDRWTWERKHKHWRPMTMIPASTWLEELTRTSSLMQGWPITRIPHVVDTEAMTPRDRMESRARLGIDLTGPLVAFLSTGGTNDPRKGWDLLEEAMVSVREQVPGTKTLVVGPNSARSSGVVDSHLVHLDTIRGSAALADVYSAADVVAVPSRHDNMPLVAMEAHACGRPVVAFAIGGLPDIVADRGRGLLAAPFDAADLASCIIRILQHGNYSEPDRIRDQSLAWSPSVIARQYTSVQEGLLA